MEFELTYADVACVLFGVAAAINGTLFVVAEQSYSELFVLILCRRAENKIYMTQKWKYLEAKPPSSLSVTEFRRSYIGIFSWG